MPQPRRNSRIRKLASHLSVIRILLDPPSPPSSDGDAGPPDSPDLDIASHSNVRDPMLTVAITSSPSSPEPTFRNPWMRSSSPSNFLQVPRDDFAAEDVPRLCSPPPRHAFNMTAMSGFTDQTTPSSFICSNMIPGGQSIRRYCNSCASYNSDDNETPPNELQASYLLRPHSTNSTQSTPAGNVSPTILLSPVLSRPVRSQSAHSPPFPQRASPVMMQGMGHSLSGASDSDTDTGSASLAGSHVSTSSHPTCHKHGPHLPSRGAQASILGVAVSTLMDGPFSTAHTPGSGHYNNFAVSSASVQRLGSAHYSMQRHGSSASDSGSTGGPLNRQRLLRTAATVSGSSPTFPSKQLSVDDSQHGSLNAPHSDTVGPSRLPTQIICGPGKLNRSRSEAVPEPSSHSGSVYNNTKLLLAASAAVGIDAGGSRGRLHLRRPSSYAVAFRNSQQNASFLTTLGQGDWDASSSSFAFCGGALASSMHRSRKQLGHSDPQLYTYSNNASRRSHSGGRSSAMHLSPASAIRFRKASTYVEHNRSHRASILSTHNQDSCLSEEQPSGYPSNPSPTIGLPNLPSIRRRRRPLVAANSGEGVAHAGAGNPPTGKPRSGSSLAAPYLLYHADNRRWSLASLPSSSGYGTPGSISALSSEYSSQEHLAGLIGDLRLQNRYDSNDSYPSVEESAMLGQRPRSRSLSSPVRFGELSVDTSPNAMSHVYKERFPKAKAQMESKLQNFLSTNAPLSGFTSPVSLDRPASPLHLTDPVNAIHQHRNSFHRQTSHRPSSPCRPTSPIPRPISPLAMSDATAAHDGKVVFRSANSSQQLQCTTPYGNSSSTYYFPGVFTNQTSSQYGSGASVLGGNDSQATSGTTNSRRSTMAQCDAPLTNPTLLRVLAEGATRFIHHQICEITADCLQKSRDDQLTSSYFCQMSIRLEESLAEARQKTNAESYKFLASISKQLLMIVSRTARLLESLEFDPDEFYKLLEETEGALRYQLGARNARVPDLPQYIIDKLGLNKNLIHEKSSPPDLLEHVGLPPCSLQDASVENLHQGDVCLRKASSAVTEDQLKALTANAPKEEDFETIRLISNGAYGAVYLVRHYKTRQRFALKKMRKQTLLLRNQVEQVYAERDILTFTDNPFVVSFYGSFETKQHLCMLMEYVEGGDCASLLKSAGILPIEVARLYVAETVLAIEYLHSCGIVHRDLKPDNLLITSIGHIKLTDFGLSKIGLMNRTTLVSEGFLDETQQFRDNQLCGTPEYIAPEVILRQGYGKPVDWWAVGVITYEFLVGIVPFLGGSPEELFTNIINEEVEYPSGEEALEPNAQNLIEMLLEKNPVDRLGTLGGAPDVAAHPFFSQLDFNSLLRQKAEFVPNLENEEDTSYFDSRTDRYNHDAESGDDESVPMFWSFSTASPRHSVTALDINIAQIAQLNSAASPVLQAPSPYDLDLYRNNPVTKEEIEEESKTEKDTGEKSGEKVMKKHVQKTLSQRTVESTSSGHKDSVEIGQFNSGGSTTVQTPTSAKHDDPTSPSAILLRQRFGATRHTNLSTSSSGTTGTGCLNTCSSTDSSMDASIFLEHGHLPSRRQTTNFTPLPRFAISSCDQNASSSQQGLASQTRRATLSAEPEPRERSKTTTGSPGSTKRTESLKVMIPGDKSVSQCSIFYHAPTPNQHASPDRQSQSSLSSCSFEPNSPQPPPNPSVLPQNVPSSSQTQQPIYSSNIVGKPIVIRKGAKGFGFTIRSVRVYLSAESEYYTIEHIVAAVREGSPADEAGLKENDLITHVHTQPVHNMTHPQLMHRLLSGAPEITLHVVPLDSTTIREGEARRTVGKLLRKKPRRPQRRVPLEKKSRKTSALFRRLSGKRGTNEIVPGASTQKQSFMPRSASSQDGVSLSISPAPMSNLLNETRFGEDGSENTFGASLCIGGLHPRPSSHRRSSGQLLLPQHSTPTINTEQRTRRKYTTGSIDIREPHCNTTVQLPQHLQGPSQGRPASTAPRPQPRHSRALQAPLSTVPSTPSSPAPQHIAKPVQCAQAVADLPTPSPYGNPAASTGQPSSVPNKSIPRPSTLLERRTSAGLRPDHGELKEARPRPTDLRKCSPPNAAHTRKNFTPNTLSKPMCSTDQGNERRESMQRPPVPARKLSPSRLVQRLFRGSNSSHDPGE